MIARPLARGDIKLMEQYQDLGALPTRQARHRHATGGNGEDRLHAYQPNIIARQPVQTCRARHRSRDRAEGAPKASARVTQVLGTHKPVAERKIT
jgi:hypothetical protein